MLLFSVFTNYLLLIIAYYWCYIFSHFEFELPWLFVLTSTFWLRVHTVFAFIFLFCKDEYQMKGYGPKMTCCDKLSQGWMREGPCMCRGHDVQENKTKWKRVFVSRYSKTAGAERKLQNMGVSECINAILAKVHAILTDSCFDSFKHHPIALLDQFIPYLL